jgi:hypothetical protein
MSRKIWPSLLLAAVVSAGCSKLFGNSNPTSPSNPTVQSLAGSWSSVSSATALQNTCTNFKWNVTEISGTTGSGTFSATCYGNLTVTGSGKGSLSGTSIAWSVTGNATGAGVTTCAVAVSGTAFWEIDQIRIPYSGTTCQGPVSGTEILRK